MKPIKCITFIMLIFFQHFSFTSWSQAVFAPVKGAKWTYIYRSSSFLSGVLSKTNGIINTTYSKDTVVEGKVYKILILNYGILDSANNSVMAKYSHKFMSRQSQDTVWGFINDKSSESIYFVFKQIPDSFTIKKLHFTDAFSKKVFIDTIQTVKFGNRSFKTWKGKSYHEKLADGYNYDTCSLTFAERIGPIDDIMPYFAFNGHPGNMDKRYKYGLVCYEDSEVGTLKFIDLDCNIVPVQNISKNILFESYYDNISRTLEIRFEESNLNQWTLSLVNISGQIMFSDVLKYTQNRISIPNSLSSGIYLIHLLNKENGNSTIKKIFIN